MADTTAGARQHHPLIATLRSFAGIFLLFIAFRAAIAEPFYIPSGSMQPTLLIGDEIVTDKFAYGYGTVSIPFVTLPLSGRIFGSLPERGDVVVFRWPGDRSQFWVKRVIGLPGDRIALRSGQVWINGEAVLLRPEGVGEAESENGALRHAQRFLETLPGGRTHAILKLVAHEPLDDMAEITLPPDHLFVMGDNRDNSADSRVPVSAGGVGMLPLSNVAGRADYTIGSWDIAMRSEPVWTWPKGLRPSRFFTRIH